MQDFVHLHVHTQYSLLDGQSSVQSLVDKAIADGMRGMAITDHGNMMAIKDFFNYYQKVVGKAKGKIKEAKARIDAIEKGEFTADAKSGDAGKSNEELIAEAQAVIAKQEKIAAFKPIFGCEMYVARRGKSIKETKQDQSGWHLVVLAKNEKGYHNLIKLVSRAWVDGYYMRPRTDHEDLKRFREGLIVSSACLGGEVPKKILAGELEEAERAILWMKETFGDDYYLELMRHEVTDPGIRANREAFPLQQQVNETLVKLSEKLGVKLICTNDTHFTNAENAEAHDRLICLSTGRDLDDPNRMVYTKQEWFKTREEMNAVFPDHPEALANTCEICDKVEVYSIDHGPIMPNFDIPKDFGTEEEYRQKYSEEDLFNEFTRDENGNVVLSEEAAHDKIKKLGGYEKLYRIKLEADYLAKLAYAGARKFYGDPLSAEVEERIKFELHIMKTMGFPGYFLIVQDFIWAARNLLGVSVGPGRGSAAGSAVAYCLEITRIDPIKYDLLFERFLNPDRISLPDIDVDFDDDGRGEVLRWVTEKYGAEKVAHIITYGTMATKMALKDVARVQKLPLDRSNYLCKLIPDKLPDKKLNLPNAIEAIPELQEAETSPDPILRDTIKYAKMLEGNVRGTGVHACGTIICRDDITDWVPVSTADDKETGEKLLVTQYEGSVIEDTGLIKMDFLGLKTLSIIKEAVANIKQSLGIDVDVDTISIDDPKTYQLYCEGRTIGTFQFESPGMQKYLRELQPSTFEDLIAMNALYRPGPMDYIPDFIDRKHGRKPIEYDIPCMEKYLKDTYGITVYQEQVMLLSRQLADFTRGESDALRKAMGKKKKDIVDKMKPKFIEGGQKNGHDPKILDKIWSDWEKFASYAFNKSHATCYSWVAYQTAYLKANYPPQYMAANLSRNLSRIDEITKLMDECKAMGINVLGPDVNESYLKFSVNAKGDIRFGLGGVKGVGEGAVEAIIKEREANGPYKNIYDFVERVNLQACNRKNLECLALSGGFDCFPEMKREHYFAENAKKEGFLDILIRYGTLVQTERASAMNSLFGMDGMSQAVSQPKVPENAPVWSTIERLNRERDLVGIYLSAHPLDEYRIILEDVCSVHLANIQEALDKKEERDVSLGGVVTAVRSGFTRNNKPFGIAKIEDFSGTYEIALFGDDWMRWSNYMIEGYFLYIKGRIVPRKYTPEVFELKVGSVELLPDVKNVLIQRITIYLQLEELNKEVINDLHTMLNAHSGHTDVYFTVKDSEGQFHADLKSRSLKISVEKDLINYIKKCNGLDYKLN